MPSTIAIQLSQSGSCHPLPELPSMEEWKQLSKRTFSRRSKNLKNIDENLGLYHTAYNVSDDHTTRNAALTDKLFNLQAAIKVWLRKKESEHGDWKKSKRGHAMGSLMAKTFPGWSLNLTSTGPDDTDPLSLIAEHAKLNFRKLLAGKRLEFKIAIRLRKLKQQILGAKGKGSLKAAASLHSTGAKTKKDAKTVADGADEISKLMSPLLAHAFEMDLPDVELPSLPNLRSLLPLFRLIEISLPKLSISPLPDLEAAMRALLSVFQCPDLLEFLSKLLPHFNLPDLDLLPDWSLPSIDLPSLPRIILPDLPIPDLDKLGELFKHILALIDLPDFKFLLFDLDISFPDLSEIKALIISLMGALKIDFGILRGLKAIRDSFLSAWRGLVDSLRTALSAWKDWILDIMNIPFPNLSGLLPRFGFRLPPMPHISFPGLPNFNLRIRLPTLPNLSAAFRFARMLARMIGDILSSVLSSFSNVFDYIKGIFSELAELLSAALKSAASAVSSMVGKVISTLHDLFKSLFGFSLPDLALSAIPLLGTLCAAGTAIKKAVAVFKQELMIRRVDSSRFAFSAEASVSASLDALKSALEAKRNQLMIAAAAAAAEFGSKLAAEVTVVGAGASAVTGPAVKIAKAVGCVYHYGSMYVEMTNANRLLEAADSAWNPEQASTDNLLWAADYPLSFEIINTSPVIGCYMLCAMDTSTIVSITMNETAKMKQKRIRSRDLSNASVSSGGDGEEELAAMLGEVIVGGGIRFGGPAWMNEVERQKREYIDPLLVSARAVIRDLPIAIEEFETWGSQPGFSQRLVAKSGIHHDHGVQGYLARFLGWNREEKMEVIYSNSSKSFPETRNGKSLKGLGFDKEKGQYYAQYA